MRFSTVSLLPFFAFYGDAFPTLAASNIAKTSPETLSVEIEKVK